jgi:hypothetical protein
LGFLEMSPFRTQGLSLLNIIISDFILKITRIEHIAAHVNALSDTDPSEPLASSATDQ